MGSDGSDRLFSYLFYSEGPTSLLVDCLVDLAVTTFTLAAAENELLETEDLAVRAFFFKVGTLGRIVFRCLDGSIKKLFATVPGGI